MISLLLLAGGLLVLFVVTLAWLEPGELLRPSRRSQLIAGVVGGGVSALVLLSLRSGPDGMAVVVHPTATAYLGLYFGPLAALISAAIALAAQLAIPSRPGALRSACWRVQSWRALPYVGMRSKTTALRACGSACWCWQPCCPPSLTPAW